MNFDIHCFVYANVFCLFSKLHSKTSLQNCIKNNTTVLKKCVFNLFTHCTPTHWVCSLLTISINKYLPTTFSMLVADCGPIEHMWACPSVHLETSLIILHSRSVVLWRAHLVPLKHLHILIVSLFFTFTFFLFSFQFMI